MVRSSDKTLRPAHARLFAFASFVWFASSALVACKSGVECTTEVTAGSGTFKASARAEDEAAAKRNALKDACTKMCVGTNASMLDSCASRCVVDAAATKIGARTTCSK